MFCRIHKTVEKRSADFQRELGRYNYTTPTSYLELLKTYGKNLIAKRKEVTQQRDRLSNGVDKLTTTGAQVADMQQQLRALQPVLEKTQVEVDAMMVQITKGHLALYIEIWRTNMNLNCEMELHSLVVND